MIQRSLKITFAFKWFARAIAFAVIFHPLSALAQADPSKAQSTGSIRGTVTTIQDKISSPIAGIAVTLDSVPPSTPSTAQTDENGKYEFLALQPGSYSVSVKISGFKTVSKSIVLSPQGQIVSDFLLQLDVVSEKVEVKENGPGATETAAPPPVTVTNTELKTLPTPEERVKDVIPFTPGVIQTLDSKLSFKGADENQSLLLVNSARTTDPVTGSFGVPIPTDAVESFTVYKTPYDATLGSFSGGLTTIQTKPPEDQWDFKLRGLVPSIRGKNGSIVGLAEAIPGVAFDVPIVREKLLFSEVFQYEMKKTTIEGLPWPYDVTKRQGFNSFSTLEAILAPNHVLTITVNAFPMRQQMVDINALVPQTASNDLDQSGIAVGVSDRHEFDSGSVVGIIAQYIRFDSNAHGQGLADMTINPEGYGGNYFNQWSRRGKEFQAVPSFTFPKAHWHGEHDIRVGADIDYRSFFGTTVSRPIQILREDNSLAQLITFGAAPPQSPSDTSVAEFVQDHWILSSRWSLDLGTRLSSEASGWSAAFAPRAGVAYSPGNSGKTVVRAGIGVFYGVLPLLAGDFAANPARTITEFGTNGLPIAAPITYTSVYSGRENPLTAASLRAQPGTTPRNITWNGQVEHELRKNLNLRVGYLDSHTTYLFTVEPFTGAIGEPSYIALTNNGSSHYREFETTVHYSFRERDQINASYIWSRSRGDINSLSNVYIPFAAPVIRPNVYGILPSDIPNRLVGYGIFALPWKLAFSPLVDIHSGFPYSPIDEQQQYAAVPYSRRFPEYFSLDAKLYREFRVPFLGNRSGKSHHIRLGVYSLNVTNHGNYNAVYNNITSPAYSKVVGLLYRHEGAIIDFID